MGTIPVAKTVVEEQTGKLFGELWTHYDEELFQQSVALFEKPWSPRDKTGLPLTFHGWNDAMPIPA